MKKLSYSVFLVLFFASYSLFAQPGNTCDNALSLACVTSGNNGAYSPTPPFSICGNPNWVENNVWYVFVLESTNITFTIDISNCNSGLGGLQAEIYSSPDCLSFTELACYAVVADYNYTISFTGTPGDTYYLMLDGWSGDVCDYEITVTDGSIEGDQPVIGIPANPMGLTAPCSAGLGFNIFSIPDVLNANSYNWTVTPAGINYTINGTDLIVNDWNGATSATICVQGVNTCALLPGAFSCITVTIDPVVPVNPPPGNYCEGEIGYVYPETGLVYTAPGSPYPVTLTSSQGCDSIVLLEVIEFPSTSEQVIATVCDGGCVTIEGQPYCIPVQGLGIPISTPNALGCDSMVFLTLEVLLPTVDISGILNLDCNNTETILFANAGNNPNPAYVWSYFWSTPDGSVSNGLFNQNILLVNGPGTYTVEVTLETPDGVMCTAIADPVIVTANAEMVETSVSTTDAPCSGTPIGSATVSATGGGGSPYSYLWDANAGSQNTATASNLTNGLYYVTVTGSNGCTAIDSATVNSSVAVLLSVDNILQVACNGENTGSATVSGSGGTPSYSYAWNTTPVQNTATVSNLLAGTYTVTITDDAGCTNTETVMITEPPVLSSSANAMPAFCNGENSGMAYVSPAGGTPSYTFLWDGNASGQTTDTAFNLPAGLYSVTITDANNCTQVINGININDPSPLSLSATTVNALCKDGTGSATALPNGGTAGYTYVWNSVPVQTTATATNLSAGIYAVTITDANGCTESLNGIVIDEPPAMTGTALITDADCNGANTGSIEILATGTNPLSYSWSANAGTPSGAIANNLPADTYSVTITDANNCTFEINTIILEAPTAVIASIDAAQNIACFGEATGSATALASGGSGTYTYLWSANAGGVNTPTINGMLADTYQVTVTDGAGCTESTSISLLQPTAPLEIMEVAVVDASCTSDDGSIAVEVTGGTPGAGYTYLWSPGGFTVEDPQNLAGGSYTLLVTDANACTASFSTTVNIPGGLTASAVASSLNCHGDANADIAVTVSGGTGMLDYSWSNVAFGNVQNVSAVGPGTYTVTITDENNCSVQTGVTITEPDSISISSLQITPASCGLNDGGIDLFVTGGTGPGTFNFSWTGGAAPVANPDNLSAGIYDVTITDGNGCVKDTSILITSPDGPTLNNITAVDVACNGEANGSINVDFSGGQGPYDFDWTGTAFDGNEDLNNVPAGLYELTITDVNNCSTISNITVNEPTALTASTSTTPVLCNGDNSGTATLIPLGGVGGYIYQWCDGQNQAIANNLPQGTCNVTLTDANACQLIASISISEPPSLTATVIQTNPADCNGSATGSIDLDVNGGMGNYSYNWSPLANAVANPQNLVAGSYAVTITDDNACSQILSGINISEPDPITFTASTIEASCNQNNGSIDLTASGGNGGYTYSWTNGADPVANPQNLVAGNYEVTITDSKNCTATGMVTISTPSALVVQSIQSTDANCFGDADGTISVVVSGGTPGYSYSWSGGLDPIANPGNVGAGNYDLEITDLDGCTLTASILIGQPDPLDISIVNIGAATCNQDNGSIDIEVLGGTPPYTYLWSNGATNQDPTGLSAGLNEVMVTDANACTFLAQIAVTEPGALNSISSVNGVSCFNAIDGSISLNTTGGNGPYNYTWNIPGVGNTNSVDNLAAGIYSVIVEDADGCLFPIPSIEILTPDALVSNEILVTDATCMANDGSIEITFTGGTGNYLYSWTSASLPFVSNQEDISNLEPGTYTLILSDENNCTISIEETIDSPTPPTATATPTPVQCFGEANGSITVSVSGANGLLNYQWNPASIGDTPNPTGLLAGIYEVTVTDEKFCTALSSVTIVEPELLDALALNATAVNCNGGADGSATITVMGGTPAYTYLWNNGATIPDPVGLSPGTYTITVTDANACTDIESVMITEPPVLELMIDAVDARCANENSGSILLTALGGNGAPFTYDWNDNQYDGMDQLADLPAGTYSVTVTDANDCSELINATITEPPMVLVTIEEISDYAGFNVSCANLSDGSASVQGSGGNGAPYTYLWEDGSTNNSIENLSAGEYAVTVSDQLACTEIANIGLIAPDPILLAAEGISVSCYGDSDGSIVIENVEGGLAPYVYSVDNSPFGQGTFTSLSPGNYELIVQDVNGCEEKQIITVSEATEFVVDLGGDQEIQLGDSVFLLAQSNGIFDSLLWLEGSENFSCLNCPDQWVIPTNTTTYSIYSQNDEGCIALDEVQIRVIKDRLVYIPSGFSPGATSTNSIFTIYAGTGVAKVKTFIIADRWGEIVFTDSNFLPNDPAHGWDGSLKGQFLNPAVFVYFAEIEFTDGRVEQYKGDVTLVR